MAYNIALTGHRPARLAGYNLRQPYYQRLQTHLEQITQGKLHDNPTLGLHSGMALGADTVWSQAILNSRAAHPDRITFTAHVPTMGQADRWPVKTDRDRWSTHLDAADQVRVYAPDGYTSTCLWERNEGLIQSADLLLAVWDGKPGGGTYGAIRLARQKGVTVIRIDPDQFRD